MLFGEAVNDMEMHIKNDDTDIAEREKRGDRNEETTE